MAIEVTRSTEARAPASGARGSQERSEAAGGFGAVLGAIDAAAEDQTPEAGDSTAAPLQQPPRADKGERAAGKTDKTDRSDKARRAQQAAEDEDQGAADALATTDDPALPPAVATAVPADAATLADAQAAAALAAAAVTPDLADVPATVALAAAARADAPETQALQAATDATAAAANDSIPAIVPTTVPASAPVAAAPAGPNAAAHADRDAGVATAASAAARARAVNTAHGQTQAHAQAQAHANAQANANAQAQAQAQSASLAAGQPETQALQQAQAAQAAARAAAVEGSGRAAVLPADLVAANAAVLAATAGDFASGRSLPRAWEARMEESRTPGGSPFADGTANRHALSADALVPVAGSPVDTAASGMEDRMDAQMSYWLSQKTHNAELTLDAADGRAVEVSIALNGNEAQVAFRADHASTRDLLGSALPQLREAMDGQGMLLAGVTVDSFGARGQGEGSGQDDSARQGRGAAGRRTVSLGEAAPAGLRSGVNRATQPGGLDLYV